MVRGPAQPSQRAAPGTGPRLLAILQVRDEMRYLPGFFANVAPKVEGIVAIDDGSTDGTYEYLRGRREVIEVLRNEPDRPRWSEMGDYRRLLAAGLRHRPDWLLAIDADERLEVGFRPRAEAAIRAAEHDGRDAIRLRVRELWDAPGQYRTDGVWGEKSASRLFRARDDHEVDDREMHGHKAPMQAVRAPGGVPVADIELYHLRMLEPEDRLRRRQRYEQMDPDARWQDVGYAYLTDEAGLELAQITPERDYRDAVVGTHRAGRRQALRERVRLRTRIRALADPRGPARRRVARSVTDVAERISPPSQSDVRAAANRLGLELFRPTVEGVRQATEALPLEIVEPDLASLSAVADRMGCDVVPRSGLEGGPGADRVAGS